MLIAMAAPMMKTSDLAAATAAIDRLLSSGHLDISEQAARRLHAAFPTLTYTRNLCGIFDRIGQWETSCV